MKAVIDTNVLVSGLLTPMGPCGEIVRLIAVGAFDVCYGTVILAEYQEVLYRTKFRFDEAKVAVILAHIRQTGIIADPRASCPGLPDPDDRPFLEAALSAKAACIVTGNRAHFPARICKPVAVVEPAEFLRLLETKE